MPIPSTNGGNCADPDFVPSPTMSSNTPRPTTTTPQPTTKQPTSGQTTSTTSSNSGCCTAIDGLTGQSAFIWGRVCGIFSRNIGVFQTICDVVFSRCQWHC